MLTAGIGKAHWVLGSGNFYIPSQVLWEVFILPKNSRALETLASELGEGPRVSPCMGCPCSTGAPKERTLGLVGGSPATAFERAQLC